VMSEIHSRISGVITEGLTWPEAFPLPWMPAPTLDEIQTVAEQRQWEIGSAMYERLGDGVPPPGAVAAAIEQVRNIFGTSDEDRPSVRTVQRAWAWYRKRFWIPQQRTGVKAEPDADTAAPVDPFGLAPQRGDRKR